MTAPATAAGPPRATPATVLFWVVVAAVLLGRFGGPLADWLGAVGTATHEVGHAATADVLTGDVAGITVFREGGGVTVSEATDAGWRRFVVAASGYPAALVAALALLTGTLLGRTGRRLAAAGAAAGLVALSLWVPREPSVPGIAGADQRFTWWVFLAASLLLASAAALPARHSTVRRVVLGAVAVSLLTDAFRAVDDLIAVEDGGLRTASDADTLAAVTGVGGSGLWAWLMRLWLLVLAAGWAWLLLGRWAAATTAAPAAPGPPDQPGGTGRGRE